MKNFTFLKRPKKKMLLHQWANLADQRKSICVSRPLSMKYIFNKRPKFTFAQSKRFPPKRNLLDKETIILAWGKSHVFSTDPPSLHRRDNNDCRSLHRTWRTLCMNKHLTNKAVGRTQKTSFPLSSISKASLCSDSKTNPSSCASKSSKSTSVILQRKL